MSLARAFACLSVASIALAAHASAQVVVVRLDPAAEPACEKLEAGLEHWQLQPDPGYFQEARRRGLDPSSDEALAMLIPALGARLAIVPRGDDPSGVNIEFRDGSSGASLGDAVIPLHDGALESDGEEALNGELQRRIGGPRSAADASESTRGARAEVAPHVRVYGGIGVGTRSFEWTRSGERQSVETGAFAAYELGIAFMIGLSDSLALGPVFAYQSSVGSKIDEHHVGGETDTMSVRAHRLDGTFAVQIGSRSSFQVTPAVGVAVHNLRPAVHHLLTPSYSIAGPLVRVAIRIPIGPVALRIAPEAAWLFTDDPLAEIGVDGKGPAVGGEVAFEIDLGHALALELTARDVRAWLPSREGAKATDTGFVGTTRLVWQP